MVKRILIFITASVFLGGVFIYTANAYEVDTHAYLTEETIQFFNRHFPEHKISNELSYYLIDGARLEAFVPQNT